MNVKAILLPLVCIVLNGGLFSQELSVSEAELQDPANWKTASKNIDVQVRKKGICFDWKGSVSEKADLRFMRTIPLNGKGYLYGKAEWKKLSHAYASQGTFMIRFFNKGETLLSIPFDLSNIRGYRPMELWEFNTPIALDEPLSYFNYWQIPAGTDKIGFSVRFEGNAMSIQLEKLEFAIVDGGNKPWESAPPEGTGLKSFVIPAPRIPDDVLLKMLKKRRKPVSELRHEGDRIELYVDGKKLVPAILNNHDNGSFDRDHLFAKAGYKLFTSAVMLGRPASESRLRQVWGEDGSIDVSVMEEAVLKLLREVPDAYVFLCLTVGTPQSWMEANPDELLRNEKGEFGILEGYKLRGEFTKKIPTERGRTAFPSLHSRKFRSYITAKLSEIFRKFEKTDAAKAVVGVYVTGGCDGQFRAPRHPERSPGATRAFRAYLKGKYGNDAALNRAWNTKGLATDQIQIPTFAELSPDRLFQSGAGHATRESDYKEFLADELYHYKTAMYRGIKLGSDSRLLTGGYNNANSLFYGTHLVDSTQYQEKMLNDDVTDFMIWIPTYHRNRDDCDMPLGLLSYNGSMVLHKKLAVAEMDIRNPEHPPLLYSNVRARNWQAFHNYTSFQNFVNLYIGYAMAWGGAFHTYLLAPNWYDTPQAIDIWTQGMKIAKAAKGHDYTDRRIAFFVDDKTHTHFTNHLKYFDQTRNYKYNPMSALWRSGVRFDCYLPQDLFHPDFKAPKLLIFGDSGTLDADFIRLARETYGRSGRVLVWLGAPGFLTTPYEKLSVGSIRFLPQEKTLPAVALHGNDPLLKNISGLFSLPPYSPSWQILDPSAKTLAVYQGTDRPAIAVKRYPDFTEVVIGQPNSVTPDFIRNLAREAGIVPFSDTNDLFIAGANMLITGASTGSGPRRITLPPDVKNVVPLTGQKITFKNHCVEFEQKYREAAVFQLEYTK